MLISPDEPDLFLVPGLPFSAAELRGMELTGVLVHVMGDLYASAVPGCAGPDGINNARLRAAAVARLAGPVMTGAWAAVGLTAAWLHAGGPAPAVLEASVVRYHRRLPHPGPVALRLEQSALAGTDHPDVGAVHGVACTLIERTIEDLLRRPAPGTRPAAVRLLRRLTPADVTALAERFEARRKRPGMIAARRALDELLSIGAPVGGRAAC